MMTYAALQDRRGQWYFEKNLILLVFKKNKNAILLIGMHYVVNLACPNIKKNKLTFRRLMSTIVVLPHR